MKKSWKSFMAVTAAAAAMTAAMAFSSLAAVAKVGETEYDDLQTAVNSGDKVVVDLLDDVTLTDGLVIGAGKDVTIRCEAEKPRTITMKKLGFITGAKNAAISNVKFVNCVIDENVANNPKASPNDPSGATTNLFNNTNLIMDHVKWKLKCDGDQIDKHGIYLNGDTNFSMLNESELTISGFNSSGSSGLYADKSDITKDSMNITVSGKSIIKISDCGFSGMLINPVNLFVQGYSSIESTNCGLNGGRSGIGCYYGKIEVTDHSSITADKNVGRSWGIFAKDLFVDGTSQVSACDNSSTGLCIAGKGTIEDGAELDVNNNGGIGLSVYCVVDPDDLEHSWFGDVTLKNGSIVNICGNKYAGIRNSYKFSAENKAVLTVKNNGNHGVDNRHEMTLNSGIVEGNKTGSSGAGIINTGSLTIGSGVRICNNHASVYGGGLYNGENGTAELADGVILYNNHADTGADDIYNTAGQKITFNIVGNGWNLDDCSHKIDGWYDDTEESKGTRWNVDGLLEERHMILVTPNTYETEFQIKAAHGADIYEASDYPIDKKANGEDEIGTVKQGSRITFTLESKLPKLLARYVVTASNASPANTSKKVRKVRVHSASGARRASGANAYDYDSEISEQVLSADEKYVIPDSVVETIVFHDEMNRYLKFTDGSIRVTAGRDGKEIPSDYYAVTASDSNAFRVEVDLVKIFNAGIIDYEDLTAENPITVSYEAVVTDDAIQGDKLFNEAWVNDGEHDSVDGDVLDEKVPSTGGMGRGIFTGMGLLFMGTAAAASWKRKRSM